MSKQKKILILLGALGLTGLAIYFAFFYKKTATQIASDLGLYTGDDLLDNCLDAIINLALTSGGTITGSGNLEWELSEAAVKYANPAMLPEDYWRIDGKVFPAGALLSVIDVTHDWKNTEAANSGNLYIPQDTLNLMWSEFNRTKSSYETIH